MFSHLTNRKATIFDTTLDWLLVNVTRHTRRGKLQQWTSYHVHSTSIPWMRYLSMNQRKSYWIRNVIKVILKCLLIYTLVHFGNCSFYRNIASASAEICQYVLNVVNDATSTGSQLLIEQYFYLFSFCPLFIDLFYYIVSAEAVANGI